MSTEATNPAISPLLRAVTAVEAGVLLVAGGGLFFLPELMGQIWPWSLTPFNARFLGAIYLASLLATVLVVAGNRWSPTRIVVPMIAIFTIIVLIISVLYLELFTGPLFATVLWFILYVGIPLNAVVHLWLYRNWPAVNPLPLSATWQTVLLLQAVLFGLYGVALLLFPAAASSFWPWPIDDFHGRMYSVAYIAPALGAFLAWRAAGPRDLRALGLTQIVLGALPILGLVIVDLSVRRVDWLAAGTWLWIGMFVLLVAPGVGMVLRAAAAPARTTPLAT